MSRILYLTFCAVVAITITLYGRPFSSEKPQVITQEYTKEKALVNFNPDTMMGKSAYVENLATGELLIAVDSELQFPLASITKVMTAVVALEQLPDNARIVITDQALAEFGNSGLYLGETWERNDLVEFMLVTSSNDAAKALALEIEGRIGSAFEKLMNEKAQTLGLVQTFYLNPTGLDMGNRLAGAYGSAHDQAKLLAYAQEKYPDIFEKTTLAQDTFSTNFGSHLAVNTNTATTEFPGLRASKTGYTDLAGGTLALVYDLLPTKKIASVVLGSTEIARFIDSRTLLDTIK